MKRRIRPVLIFLFLLGLMLLLGQIPNLNALDSLNFEPLIQYTPAPPTESEQTLCYVTKSGKKYHLDRGCSSLRRAKGVQKITLDEALGRYEPCLRCAENESSRKPSP